MAKAAVRKTTSTNARKRAAPKKKAEPQESCFVMMPFRNPFSIYYDRIFKPAILASKLKPVRADDLFRPGVIVSDMWDMIQEAKVLLAELTTKNANVFYELGLAHAIGKPIVMVSESMDDVPFDLQQLRVLLYNKDDPDWGNHLQSAIQFALEEALNNPVDAVPPMFRKIVESQAPEQDALTARIERIEKQVVENTLYRRKNTPAIRAPKARWFRGNQTIEISPNNFLTEPMVLEMLDSFSDVESEPEFQEWLSQWSLRLALPEETLEGIVRSKFNYEKISDAWPTD